MNSKQAEPMIDYSFLAELIVNKNGKEAVNEVINKYSFDELAKYYGRV